MPPSEWFVALLWKSLAADEGLVAAGRVGCRKSQQRGGAVGRLNLERLIDVGLALQPHMRRPVHHVRQMVAVQRVEHQCDRVALAARWRDSAEQKRVALDLCPDV